VEGLTLPLPHHVSQERTPGARGRAFGLARTREIANTVAAYRRMFAETHGLSGRRLAVLGEAVGRDVARRWPELGEEVDGLSAGAGQSAADIWVVNARTELLGGAGECTLAGRLDGRGVRLGQNWDWHPQLAASRVIWTVEEDGGWYTTITEAGMLGKLGLSSRGIACGLNFLTSATDGGSEGVPIHVLLRLVLSDCASLTDALGLLLNARVSASSCITLAAAEADSAALVAVELAPEGATVVWPGDDGMLAHANHFLSSPQSARDTQPAEHPSTLLRAWQLRRMVAQGAALEDALRSHFPAGEGICRHAVADAPWTERRATLLSFIADPAAPALKLTDGPPCTAEYVDVPLPS
jgi:isopenicillin-N N-acyltransferase-like protein